MMAMGRSKGIGRAPVSLSALPLDDKRGRFSLDRLRRARGPATRPAGAPAPAPQRPPAAAKPAPAARSELEASMARLWDALGAVPAERGRVLQFVSAANGEGASTVAREFALYAAKKAKKPVWLVDLDLFGAGQHAAVAADAARFGPLGKASQSSPDGSSFVAVKAAAGAPTLAPDARYVAAHAALRGRLWVTRFRKDAVRAGQAVRLSNSPRYWNALAEHAEYVIIDTPAAERSTAAATLAAQVDATVLVVAEEGADAHAPVALKAVIEARGGRIAGLVFNRARLRPPPFLEKLLS